MPWSADDIPDQSGRVAVVTGANAGLGFQTALALARRGAHVVLACRSAARGAQALDLLAARAPGSSAALMPLDLADLDSVRAFARQFGERHDRLDLLVNNAGVMVPPEGRTAAGFELQFGVNVVGHFALTGRLLGLLTRTPGARVVTLSSLAHRPARLDFGNLRGEKPYAPWREYGQSKLGDLVFALELQRRLAAAGHGLLSLAAHPGLSLTSLQRHGGRLLHVASGLLGQNAAQGALPTLYAATAPGLAPGGYYGPGGLFEVRGYPAPATIAPQARNPETARRLWDVAEQATGVAFGL